MFPVGDRCSSGRVGVPSAVDLTAKSAASRTHPNGHQDLGMFFAVAGQIVLAFLALPFVIKLYM